MTAARQEVLLAKKPKDRLRPIRPETLIGHTWAVVRAFVTMFGTVAEPTRLGREWMRFFLGNDWENAWQQFHRTCVAACCLHDIGKANNGFQDAVRGNDNAQVIRHEHLSALILYLPNAYKWLQDACQVAPEIVTAAVLGHHLKACAELNAEHPHWTLGSVLNVDRNLLILHRDSIGCLFAMAAKRLGAQRLDTTGIPDHWSFNGREGWFDASAHANKTREKLNSLKRNLTSDATRGRLIRIVRTALIVADSAGSGLVRENKPITTWLSSAFDDSQLVNGDAVQTHVIQPRINELKRAERWTDWHSFQLAADRLPRRALMLAPCGSGKTLAAWRWIAAQTATRPTARVIFLYPTRGTATEGFRDYVSWAPEADAALVHGTSRYDLQGMFEHVQDSRRDKDFTTDDQLYALAFWQRRIFSATVDQFLGFMQHSYRSTCLMPLLVDSIIVFDEVHSFDRSLFSALRRFLKEFDAPVLCMTASLPARRVNDLKECGLAVFPENLNTFQDLQTRAERQRYHVMTLADAGAAEQVAQDALAKGNRVLWVVNTIDRCQNLARRLNALCYHSRFRLNDRKKRHDMTMTAFKPNCPPVIAVTTQVCEMSLDLDADVLISEFAPVTSLIQRLGRCNRHDAGEGRLGQVFLYQPVSDKPYTSDNLVGVRQFVAALAGTKASQARLQELLEQYGPRDVEVDRYAAFLESDPWAASREEPLREGGDYTTDAILDSDRKEYERLTRAGEPIDGLVVPVPRRLVHNREYIGRYAIVPASHYDERWGFMEKPYG